MLQTGNLDGATSFLKKAIELDNQNAYAYADLGLALETQGDFRGAIQSCKHAMALGSTCIGTFNQEDALEVANDCMKRCLDEISPQKDMLVNFCGHCNQPGATARCSRCKRVVYCNVKCQRAAWKNHRLICGQGSDTQAESQSSALQTKNKGSPRNDGRTHGERESLAYQMLNEGEPWRTVADPPLGLTYCLRRC
jgi:tetratricopeptide (TPR) repeat protein